MPPLKRSSGALVTLELADRHIYVIRGQRVMLDADIAALYGVETFNLNKAVKRNLQRFPVEFMFQLTQEEAGNLTFQNGISSWGGRRTRPYAFTEHGIAMLASVLRSDRAVRTSIAIIRVFIRMRELLARNADIAARVEKLETGQNRTASIIDVLAEEIDDLATEVRRIKALPASSKRKIGFRLTDDR
jgi:hypothetical protein